LERSFPAKLKKIINVKKEPAPMARYVLGTPVAAWNWFRGAYLLNSLSSWAL